MLDEHAAWRCDLSARRYVYVWADGIHLQARLEDEKQWILVLIGATPECRRELARFTDGARESAQDWRDLLLEREQARARRALGPPSPLGFLEGRRRDLAETREQRCWVHDTASALAKLPKSQQPKAKRALQEIWTAETKAAAELPFDAFIESHTPKQFPMLRKAPDAARCRSCNVQAEPCSGRGSLRQSRANLRSARTKAPQSATQFFA